MKEKKHIDRLYQEKFKDFEAVPREAVWKSISAKLKEEKKEKVAVVPLWKRLAGVAAIISLLLLVGEWLVQPFNTNGVTVKEPVENPRKNKIVPPIKEAVTEESPKETILQIASVEKADPTSAVPAEPAERQEITEASTLSLKEALKTSPALSGTIVAAQVKQEEKDMLLEMSKRSIYEELNPTSRAEELSNNSLSSEKIEIRTQAAPIYYGNFGRGNFIDSRFNNNNSEGEVTYSYGINVAYPISDKVKIRSGVNKVSMSYNTHDIGFALSSNPYAISNINFRSQPAPEVIGSPREKNIGQPVASANRASYGSLGANMLNQKLGFIEVPVELEYNIINRRLQLNIIGGASTLFADDNLVTLNSGNVTTVLGEVSNINSISFSTNIGLGLDYNLTEKFRLNLEPMFKYQINTYNDPAGNFQPYYIGIYSGFSFRF